MNDGKKRKITAWEYQYDNGEVALLYHDAGIWRGKKINTVQSKYYQNPHKAIARIREIEAKIPGKDNFTFRKRNFKAGIEYLSDRCDMGVPIEQQSKEAQHHACAALLQMLNSCGSDVDGRRTILQVVSASLSGYIFRLCSEWELLHMVNPCPMKPPRASCAHGRMGQETHFTRSWHHFSLTQKNCLQLVLQQDLWKAICRRICRRSVMKGRSSTVHMHRSVRVSGIRKTMRNTLMNL